MPEYVLNTLQSVQNTLARVVTRSDARTSAAPLLVKLHWLPIRQRISYKLATLTFSTSTPQYLSSLLSVPRSTGYSLRSTDRPLLTACQEQEHQLQDGVSLVLCRTFSLEHIAWFYCIRYCDTFRGFKRKLKTHLIGIAANWKPYRQRLWIYAIMALYKFKYYYPRRARSASAWILFSLWMYVCLYVCMFVCMLAL